MSRRRLGAISLLILVIGVTVWWVSSEPPAYLQVGPAIDFGGLHPDLADAQARHEAMSSTLERVGSKVPGHDDIIVREALDEVFVSGMDGWIWRARLDGRDAERFVDVPLMPSGLRAAPDDDDVIYFCASRLHGESHRPEERVGLYRLRISTKEVTPVVIDVPLTPAIPAKQQHVYADDDRSAPSVGHADGDAVTRPLAFCNDLDVTSDGRRIYFTEPIAYEGASMGGGAIGEAITLGNNGRLWRHDLERNETRLVADGFHFVDGILVDPHDGPREESVLVTFTPGFAITRFYVAGPRAGEHEAVWEALPGMPDGMDRDELGRIWVGLYRKRSGFLTWAHANPWIKPLLLRLPLELLPVPSETGILVLTPDGSEALYYSMYEGDLLQDAAVVIPSRKQLFIANFDRDQRGLVRMRYPAALAP